jgi:hypothetical protein
MANPNIVQVSTINGKMMGYNLTTSNGIMIPPGSAIAATGVPTDQVYKINSITVANITSGTTAWVSVWRGTQGGTVNGPYGTSSFEGYLAYQIDIPPKATLSILGKSTSIYLNEGHNIVAVSNQNTTLRFSATYEVIS